MFLMHAYFSDYNSRYKKLKEVERYNLFLSRS